ncbi:MAG TPA: hypothetical protein DD381_01795 [Lentisphaeria bacterium]|nr:MAG: hypothetical protein A2X47_10235 [Lentisphaerae bacterium GWF2_38_69]HBM15075.1 hypothetical protein [Lentisphaeria bacterium]
MFYLERNNEIVWLNPSSASQKIDGSIIDAFDPADLVECQLSASWLERKGELIALVNGQLKISDKLPPEEKKKGDDLEYETAKEVLKLGIKQIRRSLRLKPKVYGNQIKPHNEIDLLFIWKGKLWIIDCKDRVSPHKLMENLRGDKKTLDNVLGQIKQNRTHYIKDDLVAIAETGGIMGKAVCVWKEDMPPELLSYANHLGVEFVRKDMLKEGLERILS